MRLSGQWRELHEKRFGELPADCGGLPAESGDPALRDWSSKTTTPDQFRIERYIDGFDLRTKRILQIGIGNSGLANRFHARVGEIVGTSIDEPEIQLARGAGFPNYQAVLHNKYSGSCDQLRGRFDIIVENNPTSACCCFYHLTELLRLFQSKLAEGGQIVTDRVGLAWIPEGANPRWSFDFADLAAVASVAGLDAWRIGRDTYVLSRGLPAKPDMVRRIRGSLRRAGSRGKRGVQKLARRRSGDQPRPRR